MSRRQSSKKNTAAYAASQPLLDAITYGKNKVTQQRENLSKAGDIVRNIHVQLPSVTGAQAAEDHNRSLDSIVAAWRNATEAYTEIFDSLAELTAADPSVGREAAKGHEEFQNMADTARQANKIANEWVSAVEMSIPVRSSSRPTSVEVEDEMDVDDSRYAEDVGKTEFKVEPGTGGRMEVAPGKKKKLALQQKRQRKRAVHREKVVDIKAKKSEAAKSNVNGGEADDVSMNGGVKLAAVEYEDVSAEVEARLKAKEEEKKSKKAEKKRKRGSGGSVGLEEAIQSADIPHKKRVRALSNAVEKDDPENQSAQKENGKASKRKVVNGGVEVDGGRKKRKKTG